MSTNKKKASLYRFFNLDVGKEGQPFPLCSKHRKEQKIPDNCTIRIIAEKSVDECIVCQEEQEAK